MKCRDPEDRASPLMMSAKDNDVAALKEFMKEPDFAEKLKESACCFRGFSAVWFAVREDSVEWFREVAKWHCQHGLRIEANKIARTRNGVITMESLAKYSPKIGRLLGPGYFCEGPTWEAQRLMWIGRTDCDSAFFRVPKDVIRMLVAACVTRYDFA